MKLVLGILLMIAGVVFGVYVGVWVCFIGGIVGVIDAAKAVDISAMAIAINVAKIVFTPIITVLCCTVAVFPGYAMVHTS